MGNTTVSCLNPFDQTNCQNQRAANAATFAYIYAHPGDAVRAALLAAVAPYACNDAAYNLGYGLPQLALSAVGALGEGGAALSDAASVEPSLADLSAAGAIAPDLAATSISGEVLAGTEPLAGPASQALVPYDLEFAALQGRNLLQQVTNELRARLGNDPALARSFLKPAEDAAVMREPWVLGRRAFGNAMERAVARDPRIIDVFRHMGGAYRPDFLLGDLAYELTTSNPGTIATHLRRAYVDIERLITYLPLEDPFGFFR